MSLYSFPYALPHIESSPRRVRVLFGGEYIVDTTDALLVYVLRFMHYCFGSSLMRVRSWLKPNYPFYFFKTKDIPQKYLVDAFQSQKHHLYDIVVGNRRAEAAATLYHDDELDGLIQIEFSVMDAWFEEDEQIYVHPKDPYKVRAADFIWRISYANALAPRSASTSCSRRGTSASRSTASRWPTRRAPGCSSRRACPRGTTSRSRTANSTSSCPPN